MTGAAGGTHEPAPKLVFNPRYLIAAALLFACAFLVPPLFRGAVIALAIAAIVLSPLPLGTRGVIFAVMTGLATGIASINLFAIGIFQGPITKEFGWSQTQYSLVTLIGTIVTVVSSLYIGKLFDRDGVRRWSIISVVLFALALISLYWLTPNPLHFYAVFALVPLIGAGTSSVAYSRVVARWFDRRRGQAFGAALAGIGIGGAVLSSVTQFMISSVGWRGAYVGLGLLSLLVTLPIILWKLKDDPSEVGLAPDGDPPQRTAATAGTASTIIPPPLVGFTAQETRSRPKFWQMLLAFLLLSFGIGGVLVPLVPILRASGIAPEQAAAVLGALGVALIVGSRVRRLPDGPPVRTVSSRPRSSMFPIIGVTLLALGVSGSTAVIAAVCIGLAAGAELDVVAVLITRYFGNLAYAENYGWQYAAWTMGSGSAAIVTNVVFDRMGTHTPALWAYVVFFVVAALLVLRLGAYPKLPVAAAAT
jgi:MFS family permease